MKTVDRLLNLINKVSNFVGVIALVLTFSFVFLNVLTRYVFGNGFAWSEEGARYALVALIILGVQEVTHRREHFFVDIFIRKWPIKVANFITILQDIVMIVVCAVFVKGGWDMTILNWHNRTPAIGLYSWIPYGLMMISCIVNIVYLVMQTAGDISSIKKSAESEDIMKC